MSLIHKRDTNLSEMTQVMGYCASYTPRLVEVRVSGMTIYSKKNTSIYDLYIKNYVT